MNGVMVVFACMHMRTWRLKSEQCFHTCNVHVLLMGERWDDGLNMKRVREGGGEAHENCMGPTLPLVQASYTVQT